MVRRRYKRRGIGGHTSRVSEVIDKVHALQVPRRATAPELKSFTGRLADLPSPDALLARGRALAIVEIALNEKANARQHAFFSGQGERALRISTGSSDEAVVFTGAVGSLVRGFDHESEMSPFALAKHAHWPGLLEGFPESLADCPRLDYHEDVESLTFCYWWFSGGPWRRGSLELPRLRGSDPDGSWHLLRPLTSDKEASRFLSDYYSRHFPDDVLARFATRTISRKAIEGIDIENDFGRAIDELEAAGFRVSE